MAALLCSAPASAQDRLVRVTLTAPEPVSAAYRAYAWNSGVQAHTRAPDGTLTIEVRLMRECWQVIVIDGDTRHEWLDPECEVLTPRVGVQGSPRTGIRIEWRAPHDYPFGCAIRVRGSQLLGCSVDGVYTHGPGSVDTRAVLLPGDVVEVRAYDDTGALISARVQYGNVWLPVVR